MDQGPVKETLHAEELLKYPVEINFEGLESQREIQARLFKTEAPISYDGLNEDIIAKIVDGFTPGAIKNILFFDTKGISIYSANLKTISLESRTSFDGELKEVYQLNLKEAEAKRRNRSLFQINPQNQTDCRGQVFNIELIGREVILLMFGALKRIFRLTINQETGRIDQQSEEDIPLSMLSMYHQSVVSIKPKKSKEAVYALFNQKVGLVEEFQQRMYLLEKDRISYVMTLPKKINFNLEQPRGQPYLAQNQANEVHLSRNSLRPKSSKTQSNMFFTNIKGKPIAIHMMQTGIELILTAYEPGFKKKIKK